MFTRVLAAPRWVPLALALGITVLLGGCHKGGGGGSSGAAAVLGAPQWGQFRGDVLNRGRSEGPGTATGGVVWAADVGGAVSSAVTVTAAGELLVKPAGDSLFLLRRDGTVRWQTEVGPGSRTPLVDRFGAVYLGTEDGLVVKVLADGTLRKTRVVGGSVGTGLHYAAERMVFPVSDGRLLFYDLQLNALASLQVGGIGSSVPVLVSEAQMFVASTDGNLWEIRIDPATKVPGVGTPIPVGASMSRATPCSNGVNVFAVTDEDHLVKIFKDRFDDTLEPRVVFDFDPQSGTTVGGSSSPAFGRDRTLYYGTQDGRLIALSEDGVESWSASFGAAINSSPALDADDNLYFRTADGGVHSVDRSGNLRWSRSRSDPGVGGVEASPSLDHHGRVFIGTQSGFVLCLASGPVRGQPGQDARHTGVSGAEGPSAPQLEWSVDLGATPSSPPLVLGDGTAVVVDAGGLLHRVRADGVVELPVPLGGFVDRLVIGSNGRHYATTTRGELAVYSANGVLLHVEKLTGADLSPPTLDGDDSVWVGSRTGELFRLDADGRRVSGFVGPATAVAPGVTADGDVVLAGIGGELGWFGPDGSARYLQTLPGPVTNSAPVIDDAGAVYVVTDEDLLVAVGPDGQGRWVHDPLQEVGGHGGVGGPLLGAGNTVVYATRNGVLRAVDRDSGRTTFALDLGAVVAAPPTRDLEGRLYVATEDGALRIVDGAGTLLTTIPAAALDGQPLRDSAVVAGDRGLVVFSQGGRVSRLRDGLSWSVFHGAADHRGRHTALAPRAPDPEFSLAIGGRLTSSPVVSAAGDILVQSEEGDLHVVAADGTLRHVLPVSTGVGIPAAHPRGFHLAAASSGVLFAFDPDGDSRWFVSLPGAVSGLNVSGDGTIHAATASGSLFAIDEFGAVGSQAGLGAVPSLGSPALGGDGVVRLGTAGGELLFVAGASVLGRTALPGPVTRGSPLVAPDGTTYVATDADVLVAVGTDRQIAWTFDPATGSTAGGHGDPAIMADGTVVYGAADGFLYALNPDGSLHYSFDARSAVSGAPALDGEGVAYAPTSAGSLFVVDTDGTEIFELGLAFTPLSSIAFSADGTLYVAEEDGTLFHLR